MKFLHLADLHLGKSVNEISMIPDQAYILKQILTIVKEQRVDAVLIAGDVYDRNVPSEEAVRLLDDFLRALADAGCRVFIISGNHDSDVRLQFAGKLLEQAGVYIAGSYEGSVKACMLQDAYGPLEIHMLPFVKASLVRHYYPEEDTSDYDAAVRCALRHIEGAGTEATDGRHAGQDSTEPAAEADSPRRVLLAHQFVTAGETEPEAGGSEESLLHVGTVERVRSDCFDGYDYVALGHIHRPQQVGRETVRYSGSPLKYSVSEAGQEKSAVLVCMQEKGSTAVTRIPLKPLHDLRHIKGKLADLLNPANIEDPEDFIYATLTDETVQYEAMNRLRAQYPNICKLDYDNSHTRQLLQGGAQEVQNPQSFEEIISGFFGLIEGREPSEEEWAILRDAFEEI